MTRLLLDEPPLLVMPSLAKALGLEAAIVLQQLHYWSAMAKPRDDGRRWVFNSVAQWAEQFPFWSERTTRRILAELRECGVVDAAEFNASKGDRTMFYAIDYERLSVAIGESPSVQTGHTMRPNCPDGRAKLATSLKEQETTTETTTERKATSLAPREKRATPQALALPATQDDIYIALEAAEAGKRVKVPQDESPVVIMLPINKTAATGEQVPIRESVASALQSLYPGVNVRLELRGYLEWANRKPAKRKSVTGLLESLIFWMNNEQNNPRGNNHAPAQQSAKPRRLSQVDRVRAANAARGLVFGADQYRDD